MDNREYPDGNRPYLYWASLGAFLPLLSAATLACRHSTDGHLASVHAPPVGSFERYCVEDLYAADPPSVAEADAWIKEALYDNGHANDWEAAAAISQGSYGDCSNVDTQAELAELDIRYELFNETGGACGGHSCGLGGQAFTTHNGQADYDDWTIYLTAADLLQNGWEDPPEQSVEDFRRHVINHETGHAYGLADPTPPPQIVTDSYEDCWMGFDTDDDGVEDRNVWVLSIMHNRGWCEDWSFGDLPWPTYYDRLIVDLIGEKSP